MLTSLKMYPSGLEVKMDIRQRIGAQGRWMASDQVGLQILHQVAGPVGVEVQRRVRAALRVNSGT